MKKIIIALVIAVLSFVAIYSDMTYKYTAGFSASHTAKDTFKKSNTIKLSYKTFDTAIYVIETKGSVKFDSVSIFYYNINGLKVSSTSTLKDSTVTDTANFKTFIVPVTVSKDFPKQVKCEIVTKYKPLKATTIRSYYIEFNK